MKSERLRTLKAELDADMKILEGLEGKYRKAKAKLKRIEPDELDYAGLAYTIVNIYNLMENYFLCVAKVFENTIERDRWHKDLVKRMSLEIEGVRPAVLDAGDVPLIDDLRAFRHVFRNIYQGELDTGKLNLVDSRMSDALRAFKSAHRKFSATLDRLIREVEK
ncbi:MAG: hypothetical protein HW377_991 [Actinobacteria bacterium]|nr:hypothetical protein [Actinomycetota bacterium]MBM2827850.1 hypothetical protein [Actinomycetota bacterium]